MASPPPHSEAQILPDLYGEECKGSIGYWENLGQVHGSAYQAVPMVKYYSQGGYPLVYLQDRTRFSLVMKEPTMPPSDQLISHRVDVRPYQANDVSPVGNVVKSHYKNFYLPWTAPNGAVQVYGYDRVVYEDIFAGIDMVFYSGSAGQKLAFYCWPGSDPTKLTLQFFGHDSLRVDVLGHLKVWLDNRWIELREAAAYQVGNQNEVIPLNWGASYESVNDEDLISFYFDTYDPELPLVLQIGALPLGAMTPEDELCWSSYFGGSERDEVIASTMDTDGNYLITGYTYSTFLSFQDNVGTDLLDIEGSVLLAKFSDQYQLNWTVFYGGTDDQTGTCIATKSANDIYIGGFTRADDLYPFPMAGAYNDQDGSGTADNRGFLAKFNGLGTIQWSTYFGDNGEEIHGMDIDGEGRIHIVGNCTNTFPATPLTGATSWPHAGQRDMMIARFDANDDINWCTAYGGSSSEYGHDIKCHPDGFYVSGRSTSNNNPLISGGSNSHTEPFGGMQDAVLLGFNASVTCIWATYVGGSGLDEPGYNSLAVRSDGTVFLCGLTTSVTDFPTQPAGGYFNGTGSAMGSGFICRFNGDDRGLSWGTHIGGPERTSIEAVVLANDKLFAFGFTNEPSLSTHPIAGMYNQSSMNGEDVLFSGSNGKDGIAMGFNPDTEIEYRTFFGGEQGGNGESIRTAAFGGHRLLMAGVTSKSIPPLLYFPFKNPGAPAYYDEDYDPAWTNYMDIFVTALCTDTYTGIHGAAGPTSMGTLVHLDGERYLITGLAPGLHHVEIFHTNGRLVYGSTHSSLGNCIEVDLAPYASGLYVVRARSAKGFFTGKATRQ